MFLGIAVFLWGGFQALSNQPEKIDYVNFDNPVSQVGRERAGQREQAQKENTRRRENQDEAVKILVAGLVLIIGGLLMREKLSLNSKT